MKYGKSHHGKGIRYFRKKFGLNEKELAQQLGESWTGKMIVVLEDKRRIEESVLERIAGVLFIPVSALSYFDKKIADNIIKIIGIVPEYLGRSRFLGYSPMDSMLQSYISRMLNRRE